RGFSASARGRRRADGALLLHRRGRRGARSGRLQPRIGVAGAGSRQNIRRYYLAPRLAAGHAAGSAWLHRKIVAASSRSGSPAADFWVQQPFHNLVTYSFNRGSKLAALHTAADQVLAELAALPPTDYLRQFKLKRQLRELQAEKEMGGYKRRIVNEQGVLDSTAEQVAVVKQDSAAAEQLSQVFQRAGGEIVYAMCMPIFRDGLAFYDEQGRLLRTLNICFQCLYMQTNDKLTVEAAYRVLPAPPACAVGSQGNAVVERPPTARARRNASPRGCWLGVQKDRAREPGAAARPVLERLFDEIIERQHQPALVPDIEHDVAHNHAGNTGRREQARAQPPHRGKAHQDQSHGHEGNNPDRHLLNELQLREELAYAQVVASFEPVVPLKQVLGHIQRLDEAPGKRQLQGKLHYPPQYLEG
nr:hypothetical protein [Tanacetum cinerariifolium]